MENKRGYTWAWDNENFHKTIWLESAAGNPDDRMAKFHKNMAKGWPNEITKLNFDMKKSLSKVNLSLFLTALEFYGVREIAGAKHNSKIVEWNNALMSWVKDDETPWCSSFMNAVARMAGTVNTGKPNARSWLDVGVATDAPEVGTVVIFWRGSKTGWQGHVGLFVAEYEDKIVVLGGNQSNMVRFSEYPKSRLLGYRSLYMAEPVGTSFPLQYNKDAEMALEVDHGVPATEEFNKFYRDSLSAEAHFAEVAKRIAATRPTGLDLSNLYVQKPGKSLSLIDRMKNLFA